MAEGPGDVVAPKRGGAAKQGATAKGTPWTFPQNTLEDALAIPKALEEKNAGNPLPAKDVAKAVGFRQPQDWRFKNLLRSANQYGLVTGTPSTAVHMAPLGQDVVAPSSPVQRSEALLAAFRNVKEFAAVEKHYAGKRIPEDEFFLNTLTRDFNIPRDRAAQFAEVFLANLKYLRAFTTPSTPADPTAATSETQTAITPAAKVPSPVVSREPRAREFLDSCFVMMPFGAWFDR